MQDYPKKDLPFNADKVGVSCGGKYTFTDAGDWRWLTTEEEAQYEADHARADDDGMGAAIGTASDIAPDELGDDWGKLMGDPEPDDDQAAIRNGAEAAAAGKDADVDFGIGNLISPEAERELADAAIRIINSTVGKTSTKRYVLLQVDLVNVDENSTAGELDTLTRIGTADNATIYAIAAEYRRRDLRRDLKAFMDGDSRSMEV